MKTPRVSPEARKAQKGFDMLSATDQATLKMVHGAEAHALNDVMNARVQAALETPSPKTPEAIKPSSNGVIDCGDHFEVAGFKVSKENIGEPTLPKGEIEINPKNVSLTKPQAWSSNEIDGQTLWFYNWEGAKKEVAHRGEYFPTIEELMQMLGSIPGDALEKAKALNIPLAGCRSAGSGRFYDSGDIADLWSASPDGSVSAHDVFLPRDNDEADVYWDDRGCGFSVRSFLDKRA